MLWIPTAFADASGEVADAVDTATEAAANMNIGTGDALLYAVVGFIVVFVALFIIIGAIKLTSRFVGNKSEKPAEKKEIPAAAPVAPVANAANAALAPGSCGEMKLNNVSDKDAAMIMAIIADETKTPLNELRFLSIKQIG